MRSVGFLRTIAHMLDGGTAVVSLDAHRKARRRRKVLPYARRGLLALAIGTTILGVIVLVGVIATALTPHSILPLLAALVLAGAAGWPLTTRVAAIIHRSRKHPTSVRRCRSCRASSR